MLVQEAGATVLAEWSREPVRVASKKLQVRQRRVVNEADMGRTGDREVMRPSGRGHDERIPSV